MYKITGVRGSGKTVLLGKIEQELGSSESRERGWIVCRLSPARDMLIQLASLLRKAGYEKRKKERGVNVGINLLGSGGSLGFTPSTENTIEDIGSRLEDMLDSLAENKKKLLIGIDEMSRTREMEAFTSEFGKWLRTGYPVFLVCTGLYDNIEQLSNVRNLTFFRRAKTIKTEPLNHLRMSRMYVEKLGLAPEDAARFAGLTKGYPYAFQELGVLLFKRKPDETETDLIEQLKTELFAYAYEKIWEELSDNDRALARILSEEEELSREEVLARMEKPANYPVYRDRLAKRGIVTLRRGHIGLSLPFFGAYIWEYGEIRE